MPRNNIETYIPTSGPFKGRRVRRVVEVPDRDPAKDAAHDKRLRLLALAKTLEERLTTTVHFETKRYSADARARDRMAKLAAEASAAIAAGTLPTEPDWRGVGKPHTYLARNGQRIELNAQQTIDLFRLASANERAELLRADALATRIEAGELLNPESPSVWNFDPE